MMLIAVALLSCAGAAWMDHRTRTVPNKWWLYTLALASPFLIAELITSPSTWLWRMAWAAVSLAVLGVLYAGQVFGGADLKGLATVSILLTPVGYYAPLSGYIHPVFDAALVALVIGEAWRRLRGWRSFPFFVAFAPALFVGTVGGPTLWWPIAWLARLLV